MERKKFIKQLFLVLQDIYNYLYTQNNKPYLNNYIVVSTADMQISLWNTNSKCLFWFQGQMAIGTLWWMLAREVLRLRGTISRDHPWDVMVDLYFYRDPEEASSVICIRCDLGR